MRRSRKSAIARPAIAARSAARSAISIRPPSWSRSRPPWTRKCRSPARTALAAIDFAEFPVAYMTPAIELDEMLTAVAFPCWGARHGYAFVEFARRHGDFAIVSAAALIEEDASGKVTRASVTLGGMGPAPVRARDVERALIGEKIEEKRLAEICETLRSARRRRRHSRARLLSPATGDGAAAPRAPQSASAPHRRGAGMSETRKISLTVNGKTYERNRAGAGDARRFPAASARPDRHPSRLRARRLRRLHRFCSTATPRAPASCSRSRPTAMRS